MSESKYQPQVGKKSSLFFEEMTAVRLDAFKSAVRAFGGVSAMEVPPTWMTICRKGEFELFSTVGIPLSNVLHAEQEYVYAASLQPGDRVEYDTQLITAIEKGSARKTHFLVFVTEVRVSGRLPSTIGTARTTIAVRE